MAEKLGHRNEVRELKIGQSFTDPKHTAFHTVKYDFKPASVDTNKKAAVDVAGNNQVTVTVPHLDGAGVPQTVFKGSQRPYQKECVLIIDRVTGEITLEKLSCNIQVKKTRSEFNKMHLPNADRLSQSNQDKSTTSSSLSRSQTPPAVTVAQRVSHKTKVTTSGRQRRPVSTTPQQSQHNLVPKHSPLHASPSYHPSPMHTKSPKRDLQSVNTGLSESHSQSTLASLPMIGVDDFSDMNMPTPNSQSNQSSQSSSHYSSSQPAQIPQYATNSHHHKSNNDHNSFHNNNNNNHHQLSDNENGVGEITDSSSSSSDSDSDSDDNTPKAANNTVIKNVNTSKTTNGYTNGNTNSSSMKLGTDIYDDLCLSESESDSD